MCSISRLPPVTFPLSTYCIIEKYILLLPPILHNPVSCGADGLLGDAHDADDLASFLCITPQMLSKIRKNNSLKLVSEFHPRHPIFGLVGGFFVGLSVTLWLGVTLGGGYSMT